MAVNTAERTPNRGEVKPGKVQCNWRIDERALNLAREAAPELGFASVPALVNVMLLKVLSNQKIKKAVFGGV